MYTRSFSVSAAALALVSIATASLIQHHPRQSNVSIYPNIADTSHATASLVEFAHDYFTAKSLHDVQAWINEFDPTQAVYGDGTLGSRTSQPNLTAAFASLVTSWGTDARSYPLRIIGDLNSAVIMFVDTPTMFGAEIRSISAFDFTNGKIVRQVDYWDARDSPLVTLKAPDDQFPSDFGELTITTTPDPAIRNATDLLYAALSTGNSTAAAELFTFDAVLEEKTVRARIEGQLAIERYLNRTLPLLPYGTGATIRHVVGSAQGGAYEWIGGSGAIALDGIIALDLDSDGNIIRFTSVWDASQTSNTTMATLAGLSIE